MSPVRAWRLTERAILLTALICAAAAIAVVFGLRSRGDDPSTGAARDHARDLTTAAVVSDVAHRWATAWIAGDSAAMKRLAVRPASGLAAKVASFHDGLRITALRVSPRTPEVHGTRAIVALDVAADIEALGTWVYTTTLPMVLPTTASSPRDWRVEWSRGALHPALTGSRKLGIVRTFGPRAPLLAGDGTPLSGPGATSTPALVRQLIGRVGTADADGDGRLAGDPKGISGLQAAFDGELGGSPSGAVNVLDGSTVVTIDHIDGRASSPVRTSIDLHVQRVAESVLGTVVDHPAALVAIRPSTGEVVAITSMPLEGFNRVLRGKYPPGSTFKVITTAALLQTGVGPETRTTCPHDVTVNGRVFQNAEDEELGTIPFKLAFAHSCNTAFVQLAEKLQPSDLTSAAELLGFNQPSTAEVSAEVPSFPELHGVIDQVSSAIGQGRVLTTPLQMASVAATVASGTRRPVTFRQVTEAPAGVPLPPGMASALQALMHLVVTDGTAKPARLPPGTAGKTGTAEFGHADPPQTHAWFIGFRGDLAFAVLVEDGGFGGAVAAPLARSFLQQL